MPRFVGVTGETTDEARTVDAVVLMDAMVRGLPVRSLVGAAFGGVDGRTTTGTGGTGGTDVSSF